jgi:uncharacterized membrane protein YbhN (UPF0104 family)
MRLDREGSFFEDARLHYQGCYSMYCSMSASSRWRPLISPLKEVRRDGRVQLKRVLSFLIKAVISAGLVGLAARNLDLREIGRAMVQIESWAVVAAFLAFFVQSFLIATRWCHIMRAIGGELRYRSAVAAVMVGLFFNQGLPSSLGGDAVRVWRLHGAGTPLRISVRSVLVDRLIGLISLGILAAVGLPMLVAQIGYTPLAGLATLLAAAAILGPALLLWIGARLARLVPDRLGRSIVELSADLWVVFASPVVLRSVMGPALATHALSLLGILILSRNLGLDFDSWDAVALVPPVLIVSVLPISLAGWGVREGAMVAFFGAAGFTGPEPFALSILVGLLLLAGGLVGGVVWLCDGSLRREIHHQRVMQQDSRDSRS